MRSFDELAENWFFKALEMLPGEVLHVPSYSLSQAKSVRRSLLNIQNSYLKVHALEASKIIISELKEIDGKWFVDLQRITTQTQTYYTDENGENVAVNIDPDRKRTIMNMLKDGYKLKHIHKVLNLTKAERKLFFH